MRRLSSFQTSVSFTQRRLINGSRSFFGLGLSGSARTVNGIRKLSSSAACGWPTSVTTTGSSSDGSDGRAVAITIQACPGCGALAQTIEPGEAGHYSWKRKVVQSYVVSKTNAHSPWDPHAKISEQALRGMSTAQTDAAGMDVQSANAAGTPQAAAPETPLCDRCHDLLNHHKGNPIDHPSVDSIHDTIGESPHTHNHIYHVVDAADFPMSVIPNIHKELAASLQRSKNRRAKHAGYRYGKKTEVSFVITRSDLLAPTKEQVDGLMPYMISVLRDSLGSYAESARLGNVRLVSAKRGWWTKELKSAIWERGGGGWMVGKANVGKSRLFEAVFPKGHTEHIAVGRAVTRTTSSRQSREAGLEVLPKQPAQVAERSVEDENMLLPPARAETAYPLMPIISSLPGTTAAPIRIPFGDGRGELIDLPGLSRSSLDRFVKPDQQGRLLMKSRTVPDQFSLQRGQCLLLSDLVRITPRDPDTTILAYPFVPVPIHVTSAQKAADIQAGLRSETTALELMLTAEGAASVKSAGVYKLQWDVTKQRTGPLTDTAAVGLRPQVLPFKVMSTDILIEGLGWVELVAQVRKRKTSQAETPHSAEQQGGQDVWDEIPSRQGEETRAGHDASEDFPEVEIFSPGGRYVACRRPMGAWLLNASRARTAKKRQPGRPRQSMVSVKTQRMKSGE